MSTSQAKHTQVSKHQGPSYVSVNTDLIDGKENDNSDPILSGWPREPLSLQGGTTASVVTIAKDCLLLVFPLLFILLAALAYRLDGQGLSAHGSHVEAAARLGPTVFPIAFAAIASKSIRSLARKLVERGERIGVLEQLLGSQSLAGTLARLTELRHHHVLGISIVAAWVLSPLGGQSALRLLSTERFQIVNNQRLAYNMLGNSSLSWLVGSDAVEAQPAMAAFYSAALLGAEKNKNEPADLWGNPKVPFLESLNQENDGWSTVANKTGLQYSSLVGVRLQGLCRDCNMTFSTETSYTNFSCRNSIHNIPRDQIMAYIGTTYLGWKPTNQTEPFSGLSFQVGKEMPISSFLSTNRLFVSDQVEEDEITTILYVTQGLFDRRLAASIYNCTMETTRAEAIVSCQEGKCGVTRMRHSRFDTRPPNWTVLHSYTLRAQNLFNWFPFASGYTQFQQASPTDNFIYGDTAPFNYTFPRDWTTLLDSDISQRLTMVFNSILQTTEAPYSITNANTFQPLRCIEPVPPGSWSAVDDCEHMNFTTATVTRGEGRYKASLVWISLLVVASIVLLLLGISTIVLHFITSAPDILGYVSSMTRDNPYVNVPAGGSALDGPSRARALRDVRVRLADVRGHDEVGYIALTTSEEDEGDLNAKYERKSRLYR